MKLNTIRKSFLDFFHNNGHKILPSSSLIPDQDPTLMFTNSGMVQFKNYFTGVQTPEFTRVTTSQKCVRAGGKHNDLDNVGYTARHHTFFEMLGNFSFGDYFKEHAIELAWKYLTSELSINKEKLYITIYHDDLEAYSIWKKLTGFSDDRIIKIATSDNFWSMGDLGPCGPCSEIFYDHGDKYEGGLPGAADADGDRFVEIWNLVFMQYEQMQDGTRIKLPKPSIDTGMGTERVAAVLQGKNDNYETDLFVSLINSIKDLAGDIQTNASHKVIADHLRSSCFLIASGVSPSNDGRGYVLRRIMRRAMRHVHQLGYKDSMMYKLIPALVTEMGEAYPELRRAEGFITSTLKTEEERFRETLERGLKLLHASIDTIHKGEVMDGAIAFKLYDTYGFPLDLTKDILRSHKIELDDLGFEKHMEEQRERARASWVGSGAKSDSVLWYRIYEELGATEFIGYSTNSAQAKIVKIIQDGKIVESATSGDIIVVLNQTPFYAESGGQIGDMGTIGEEKVTDTQKYIGKVFVHAITLSGRSKFTVGDNVAVVIDETRRNAIRANHSATHLLHSALREVLGEHVTQKGSVVTDTKLRFDFSHNFALTQDELEKIEGLINLMIMSNHSATTEIMSTDAAVEKGAMALFGEKYDSEVRVVEIGKSVELCGGTHVSRSGDIGLFKIISDTSIASGIRRIEALTGLYALQWINSKVNTLKEIMHSLKCAEPDVKTKVENLLTEKRFAEKEIQNLKIKSIMQAPGREEIIGAAHYYIKNISGIEPKNIKSVADLIKNNKSDCILIICSEYEEKYSIFIHALGNMKERYGASELLNKLRVPLDAKGGGNKEIAQANCRKFDELELVQILYQISESN